MSAYSETTIRPEAFMRGRCMDMASTVGRATGLPVMRLRTRRGSLAHAFVVVDRHLPRRDWKCVDASGTRSLREIVDDVEPNHGPVALSRDETPATMRDVDADDAMRCARTIPHIVEIMQSHRPLDPLSPPSGFEPTLESARAIAEHVARFSPHDVDLEFAEESFFGQRAVLEWLPMGAIAIRPGDGHRAVPSRERTYMRMHAGSRPPILVSADGEIEDGHHRHRVAQSRGDPGMWCYRIQEEDAE
jgi:hypothetical protein